MKLSWGVIASSLYCTAAAARDAHVYLFDNAPRPSTQASSTVDPETARLILAQRLGLSRFHSIKNPTDETLKQLNAFGGRSQKLFGAEDPDKSKAHVLVWIEGVEDAKDIIKNTKPWTSSFTMENAPLAEDNTRLIHHLSQQAESLPPKADPKGNTYASTHQIDRELSHFGQYAVYNEYLSVMHHAVVDKMAQEDQKIISQSLSNLLQSNEDLKEAERFAITVVISPPSSAKAKRSAHPYGSYDLPTNLEARREPSEAPMSLLSPKPAASADLPADMETMPVVIMDDDSDNGTSNVTAPLGILPRCFESASACNKATNTCSGHGKCSMIQKGTGGTEGTQDCYGCVCQPTVEDRTVGMETHNKTTYWGGPACQKKDITVPFWLFATSGVLFAFLISGGIGLLYSVGSEELPSVIGAGVSGPARK